MENEDFSNSPIYRLVNRYNALNTQTILCVNEKTLGDDVKKTISLLSNLSNVSVKAIPEKLNDKILLEQTFKNMEKMLEVLFSE